jgi:hypothetical protein
MSMQDKKLKKIKKEGSEEERKEKINKKWKKAMNLERGGERGEREETKDGRENEKTKNNKLWKRRRYNLEAIMDLGEKRSQKRRTQLSSLLILPHFIFFNVQSTTLFNSLCVDHYSSFSTFSKLYKSIKSHLIFFSFVSWFMLEKGYIN